MYIRKKRNKSKSISVQILKKEGGKTKLVRTVGCAHGLDDELRLEKEAERIKKGLERQCSFDFYTSRERVIIEYLRTGIKPHVVSVGPDLVLGKVFDRIGFNKIGETLFRDIVLSRLVYPVSKLKTTEYLLYHKNQLVDVSKIYRFLDKFHRDYKPKVERIAFEYTKSIVKKISIVFYDMTTLYFEAEDEDDLRKIGFSKDGKFQNPQIMLGLLVAENAYPIGYDIFEGNTFEGKTLLPIIKQIQAKYNFPSPIVVADSGLLSNSNINELQSQQYEFILGSRIRNESAEIRTAILSKAKKIKNGMSFVINKGGGLRLIVSYSDKRAKKDAANRKKGLKRLERRIKTGKLTKQNLVNRGYNKFLTFESDVKVSIDQTKVLVDSMWDGLKGYITNSTLSPDRIIQNYKHLWQIEKAFRISKTDLRIRPIFHRKKDRIAAHICIAFAAYTVYKELERILEHNGINLSAKKAIDLTKTIFQLEFLLPDSLQTVKTFSNLSHDQLSLLKI